MTESTNFVSEEDFKVLLNSLPSQYHYQDKLNQEDWSMLFTVMYGCALRIKEITTLTPENFDLEHKILTLTQTKTGWKKTKEGKIRKAQRTTILPNDAEILKPYLDKKARGERVWPVTRQTIWHKFKNTCKSAGLDYFWQKDERAFKNAWPYLLRSSRAKIMEHKKAELSLIMLKMRHKGQLVTFRYTAQDIHALLAWELENYTAPMISQVSLNVGET